MRPLASRPLDGCLRETWTDALTNSGRLISTKTVARPLLRTKFPIPPHPDFDHLRNPVEDSSSTTKNEEHEPGT